MRILQSEKPRPLDLLAVGSDGLVAAACSTIGMGGDVEVWTITTGAMQHRTLVSDREARSLAFMPGNRYLFVAEPSSVVLFDLQGEDVVNGPSPVLGYPEIALSTDGQRLIVTEAREHRGYIAMKTVSEGPKFVGLWADGPDGSFWYKLPAISPANNRIAVARRGSYSGGEMIQIRNATSGNVQTSILSDPADLAQQLVFSADGSKLLVRRLSRTIQMIDTTIGAAAGELVHTGRPFVTCVAVHPNGTVACSRNNGTVCLWDIEKRELQRVLDWKVGKLVSVAFSPDGSIGAAGTDDGQVVVWDVDE
jgi:WD40 repeat protein